MVQTFHYNVIIIYFGFLYRKSPLYYWVINFPEGNLFFFHSENQSLMDTLKVPKKSPKECWMKKRLTWTRHLITRTETVWASENLWISGRLNNILWIGLEKRPDVIQSRVFFLDKHQRASEAMCQTNGLIYTFCLL